MKKSSATADALNAVTYSLRYRRITINNLQLEDLALKFHALCTGGDAPVFSESPGVGDFFFMQHVLFLPPRRYVSIVLSRISNNQ